jgi:hypothetical protein
VNGFSLDIPNASTATLTALQPQSPTGRKTPLAVDNGKVTLDVSERSVFVAVP